MVLFSSQSFSRDISNLGCIVLRRTLYLPLTVGSLPNFSSYNVKIKTVTVFDLNFP